MSGTTLRQGLNLLSFSFVLDYELPWEEYHLLGIRGLGGPNKVGEGLGCEHSVAHIPSAGEQVLHAGPGRPFTEAPSETKVVLLNLSVPLPIHK